MDERSTGHVAFVGDFEYFQGPNGDLYRAATHYPIAVNGYRQGARFECAPHAIKAAIARAQAFEELG